MNRQEYAMVGDVVNLAARLMIVASKLGHPVLCDNSTHSLCNEDFWFGDSLPPVMVKGKSQLVEIFRPTAKKKKGGSMTLSNTQVVARKTEQEKIEKLILQFYQVMREKSKEKQMEDPHKLPKLQSFHSEGEMSVQLYNPSPKRKNSTKKDKGIFTFLEGPLGCGKAKQISSNKII